uniref:hypothetical protein n=1 Tax=Burkholderia sp. M701 TaxID=326454 RepID=UPI00159EC07F|nr:hypothetical protein [Burkholderia sp. M701]
MAPVAITLAPYAALGATDPATAIAPQRGGAGRGDGVGHLLATHFVRMAYTRAKVVARAASQPGLGLDL